MDNTMKIIKMAKKILKGMEPTNSFPWLVINDEWLYFTNGFIMIKHKNSSCLKNGRMTYLEAMSFLKTKDQMLSDIEGYVKKVQDIYTKLDYPYEEYTFEEAPIRFEKDDTVRPAVKLSDINNIMDFYTKKDPVYVRVPISEDGTTNRYSKLFFKGISKFGGEMEVVIMPIRVS